MTFMSQKCTNLLEKLYQMDAFAMSHHVFKETWTRFAGEKLDKAM